MEGIFEFTGIMVLDLYQYAQALLKKKMKTFDEADLQKSYAREQGKDDEIVTIEIISRQIGRKLKTRIKTAPLTGFNIAPYKDPSITS